MKYEIQDENYKIIKTVEASCIDEVIEQLDENGKTPFEVYRTPGKMWAYNGKFKIVRKDK